MHTCYSQTKQTLVVSMELSVLEQCRAKTRAFKQGMMGELLTGRIRLV